ncbi:MAG: TonB-dependent receptor, partial [Bacteroidales bacterium]|nr:TonB-dependent receptor [Bacteroidales bacterium]
QGDPSAVHKPQIGLAIPDSLLRFDMDFGYEVFEKPYQGAYNFKPYMLAMKPDKDAFRGKRLYLKAGAGYSLHPQVDFVFSPEPKGPLQMSVYAGHRSYFGKYNVLDATRIDGVYNVQRVPGSSFMGYDMLNSVGFEGSYILPKAIVSFGVGYEGIMARDTITRRSLNAAVFNIAVRSNRNDDKYLFYDIALNGRFAGDRSPYWNALNESGFTLSGNVGPVLDPNNAVLVGLEARTVSYSRLYDCNAGQIVLIPKYRLTMGKFDASIGVRVEALLRPKTVAESYPATSIFVLPPSMFQTKGSVFFPDVHLSYLATDNLLAYASATGGNKLNTYSSLVSRHHFLNPIFTHPLPLMDNSTEKINAKLGLKGNAGAKLQFEVDGGVAFVGNGLVDSGHAVYRNRTDVSSFVPTVAYSDYSLLYADAIMDLNAGDLHIDGGIHLRKMTIKHELDYGLLLPRVSADFKAVYDFTPRVYAGVRTEICGARHGRVMAGPEVNTPSYDVKIPGWFDLGLLGGWQFNRKLGFWLESGNLLCETIQRSPFYSEKDFWITAGITLNL